MNQTFEKSSLVMTRKLDDMIELPKSQPKRTYEDLECEMVMVKIPRYMQWLYAYDEPRGDLDMMEDEAENPSPLSTTQVLLSFEIYTLPVTYLKEVEEAIEIPMKVEHLDHKKLEDLGLNTCNHDLFFSSWEVPSVDKSEPLLLPNFSPLDKPAFPKKLRMAFTFVGYEVRLVHVLDRMKPPGFLAGYLLPLFRSISHRDQPCDGFIFDSQTLLSFVNVNYGTGSSEESLEMPYLKKRESGIRLILVPKSAKEFFTSIGFLLFNPWNVHTPWISQISRMSTMFSVCSAGRTIGLWKPAELGEECSCRLLREDNGLVRKLADDEASSSKRFLEGFCQLLNATTSHGGDF
nr:hypothetical protein [Tanacetum cinerariifolium]